MELLNLHYFMAAARCNNFTKAAKNTYTSQSNISKQISALEEELGVTLFERAKTGVKLTPAGEYLYKGLNTLLPALDELLEKTSEAANMDSRMTLRLGLCNTMDLERIIPDFILSLNRKNIDISIDFSTFSFNEIPEKLSMELIDCAFIYNVLLMDIPASEHFPINRGNPRLYYSEKHRLFGKANLCVDDFKDDVFINVMPAPGAIGQYDALPFTPKHLIKEKSLNTAFLYIISGSAVAVFGPSQNMLNRNDIHTIELPTEQKVGTDAVWLSSNTNPALSEFIHFLKEL